jgi:uncharacterized protein (DUF58 family)
MRRLASELSGWAMGAIAIVMLGIVAGAPAVVFVGGAILIIRVLTDVWPRRVLDELEYQHVVTPDRTVVGEEVEGRLSLWNRSRLPIAWATAEDASAEALLVRDKARPALGEAAASLRIGGPLRPYERMTRRFGLRPMRRGVHEVGPASLGVAELFGSHTLRRDLDERPQLVIARPLTAPLVGRLPTEAPLAQQRARRSLFSDPTLFAGVRPFQAGDSLRSIHWRATARQAAVQTKRFEPSLSAQATIVFDVQTIEGPYWMLAYDEQLFEELAVAALSVARELIKRQTPCGFAAAGFTGSLQRLVFLPPRADRAQLGRIGDALARLSTESSAPLAQLLAWLPQRVARGTSLLVLSGRGATSSATVARRLRESGFAVHFLLFGEGSQSAAEARRLGLSGWPARVDAEHGLPRTVVVEAA